MAKHRFRALLQAVCFALLLGAASPAPAIGEDDALSRGLELFERERYAEARREFNNAVSAEPVSAEAHFYLGLSSSRLEDYEGAVEAFEKALALDPELPGAHVSLGIAHYERGDYEAAARELEQEVDSNPDEAAAHFFLGLTHQRLGHTEQSVTSFQRAARLDPSFEQLALYNIGLSYVEARQPKEAGPVLERAIAVDPDSEAADSARQLLRVVEAEEKRRKRWSLSGRIGLEVDDNVSVSELDASSGEADVAGVFEVAGAFRVLDGSDYDAEVAYDFYQSVYSDVTDANLQSHTFSVDGSKGILAVDGGLSYRFTTSTLGGDSFLDLHNLLPSVGYSLLPSWYAILGFNYQNKNFHTEDDRDADHYALALDNFVFFRDGAASLALGYRLQKEDTRGAEFEYLGNLVNLRVKSPLAIRSFDFDATAFFQYQSRAYSNVTPSIGKKRDDDRFSFALGFSKALNRIVRAHLDYQYFNSSSNLPEADYDQNIVTLSMGVEF